MRSGIARALLCGLWPAIAMPVFGSDIASAARELRNDPKAALALAQQQLQALPVNEAHLVMERLREGERADDAVYRAKEAGRNRVVVD